MARLTKNPAPGHWSDYGTCYEISPAGRRRKNTEQCADWEERAAKEKESLEAFDVNDVYAMPVADGAARYWIKSEQPLVLAHIPYMDAYRLMPAELRKVTMKQVEAVRYFNELIGSMAGAN